MLYITNHNSNITYYRSGRQCGSRLYRNTFTRLLQAGDKLNKYNINIKLLTSKDDRYEVHTINMKTDSTPLLENLSQSNACAQIVHTKQDHRRLFPDCFQGLGNFQDEPYHIEVYPSVLSKRLQVGLYLITNKQLWSSNWQKCKHQASSSQLTMPLHVSTILS